eukprot:scaffold33270_cov48-Prasinocladus_malaysianus.AAC.1
MGGRLCRAYVGKQDIVPVSGTPGQPVIRGGEHHALSGLLLISGCILPREQEEVVEVVHHYCVIISSQRFLGVVHLRVNRIAAQQRLEAAGMARLGAIAEVRRSGDIPGRVHCDTAVRSK